MTGIALNLSMENICTITVGVKSQQFLLNLTDGRGRSLEGGGGWAVYSCV